MAKQTIKKNVKVRKKSNVIIPVGIVHVFASFNNTIVTITDPSGKPISWSSGGKFNKGSRKSSAFAGTVVAQDAAKGALDVGMREVEVILKGPGAGRESAVRGLQSSGLHINSIRDKTPVAHNGCRPKKRRRV